MSAALQPNLLDTPKGFVPLLTRRAVLASVIDQCDKQFSSDHLIEWVGSEHFDPVFDISVRGGEPAAARKPLAEWRFFPPAVEQFIRWINNPKTPWRTWSTEEVVARLFFRDARILGGSAIKGPMLQMILGCEKDHVLRLVEAGELRQLGEYRRGHGGEAVIEMRSLQTFLTERQLRHE